MQGLVIAIRFSGMTCWISGWANLFLHHLEEFGYRVRNFRGRVSYFNQSEARKHPFLASDWLKYETLPRKFRTL